MKRFWVFSFLLINSVAVHGQSLDLRKDCKAVSTSSIVCGEKIYMGSMSPTFIAQDNTYVRNAKLEQEYAKYGVLAGCKFQDEQQLVIYCTDIRRAHSGLYTRVTTPDTRTPATVSDSTNNVGRGRGRGLAASWVDSTGVEIQKPVPPKKVNDN